MSNLEKELKELYFNVVKKFPRIKEGYIIPKYYTNHNFIAAIFTSHPWFKYSSKTELAAGRLFEDFSNEEKEAIIAHELGHYEQFDKNQNINRFDRQIKWMRKYNTHEKFRLFYKVACLLSKRIKHKDERLKKWYLLTEFYADRKAAEAGYREQMILVLKKILSIYSLMVKEKKINIRIKKLEEKLRV